MKKNPDLIQQKIKTLKKQKKIKCPLAYIDEFQLGPQIMNEIQVLIDEKEANLYLRVQVLASLKSLLKSTWRQDDS